MTTPTPPAEPFQFIVQECHADVRSVSIHLVATRAPSSDADIDFIASMMKRPGVVVELADQWAERDANRRELEAWLADMAEWSDRYRAILAARKTTDLKINVRTDLDPSKVAQAIQDAINIHKRRPDDDGTAGVLVPS
jgi:hypothetical protein